jgi:hypothetical protein
MSQISLHYITAPSLVGTEQVPVLNYSVNDCNSPRKCHSTIRTIDTCPSINFPSNADRSETRVPKTGVAGVGNLGRGVVGEGSTPYRLVEDPSWSLTVVSTLQDGVEGGLSKTPIVVVSAAFPNIILGKLYSS